VDEGDLVAPDALGDQAVADLVVDEVTEPALFRRLAFAHPLRVLALQLSGRQR